MYKVTLLGDQFQIGPFHFLNRLFISSIIESDVSFLLELDHLERISLGWMIG